MSEENALVVVEQRDVNFYEDELTAVRATDGHIYVSLRQMCEALGIDAQAQRRRIVRHDVLIDGLQRGAILTPLSGEQSTNVLRVDLVPLWLSGIRTKSVREGVRPKLERFQREAAKVLWEAFREGRLTLSESFDDLLDAQADSPDVQAYKMAMAIMKMARQQIILRQQIESHTTQLEGHEQRLDQIEATLGDTDRHISGKQASRISQAVKAIALELGKRSGRNEFGGVYGELYRRFEIAGYRELPAGKYDEAMSFLRQWYGSLTDDDVIPF
jgi:ferritin-like metal-binding protein YciE